jgi:uncharacterized protein (TIGR03067 family)
MFMRYYGMLVVAAGLLAVAVRADETKEVAGDKKHVQGEWQVVSSEVEGEKAPAEFLKQCKVVVKDDTIAFVVGDEKHEHKFKLDPTTSPKSIDMEGLDGADKGKTMFGIYTVEKGVIKLCLPIRAGNKATERPKEFKTKEGDRLSVFTLEPSKPK